MVGRPREQQTSDFLVVGLWPIPSRASTGRRRERSDGGVQAPRGDGVQRRVMTIIAPENVDIVTARDWDLGRREPIPPSKGAELLRYPLPSLINPRPTKIRRRPCSSGHLRL